MLCSHLMPYSIDLRKKTLAYCKRTGSITEASHVFPNLGTKPRKVDRDRLKNYLTENPDAYLTEIASKFGCHPTIAY